MSESTREQLLEQLEDSQRRVSAVLAPMEPVQDWQREPVEWSFRYIAAHLATVEEGCHLPRVERIAAGDNPRLTRYNYKSDLDRGNTGKVFPPGYAGRPAGAPARIDESLRLL